jgi:hypothetical protein
VKLTSIYDDAIHIKDDGFQLFLFHDMIGLVLGAKYGNGAVKRVEK